MKGGHDLGGQQDMGLINPEPESQEPVFHNEWERRVFGLTLAAGMLGKWNIDESRHARERQDPITYVENSYYENWLEGLEKLVVEKGLVDANELAQRRTATPQITEPLVAPDSEIAEKILSTGAPSTMPADTKPLFRVGGKVLLKASQSEGHTRAPKYAQGAIGSIVACIGCHSFPDSNAKGIQEGKHLYRVAFKADELWDGSLAKDEVLIDLWEPYLETATN